VVGATASAAPVDPGLVEAAVVPPPKRNGYQASERLPDEDEELVVDEVVIPGVGVGPTGSVSSGRVIGVSGFRRSVGSPLGGTSSVSSGPCASFIKLARPWFQVAAPVGFRQSKPYTPWASRVSESAETGYVPGVVGIPSFTSWVSGGTAGALVDEDEEQAASEEASNSAAATRTDGSALRRR
jgi:hypothetical protein